MSKMHITRRDALIGAAAVAGVTAVGLRVDAKESKLVSLLVTDARFDQSRKLALQVGAAARHQLDVAQDLCHHWYGSLREAVMREQGTLTGLTTWIDFEVMRGCAAEAGLVLRSHRQIVPEGRRTLLVSWVFGPRS